MKLSFLERGVHTIGMHNYHGPSVCSMLNSEYLERPLTGIFVLYSLLFLRRMMKMEIAQGKELNSLQQICMNWKAAF